MVVLVDFFVHRYLGKLADFAEGEICRVLGVEKEIEQLRMKLARISPHLRAADQRRHVDEAINTWVTELKDIMYDAEDIIDDCMLQGGELLKLHPPSSSSSSSSSVVSLPFHLFSSCFACTKYRHEIANRIEQLNARLKEISEDSQIISILVQNSTSTSTQHYGARCRETTPMEVKDDIVGMQIEKAAEDLITRILREEKQKKCTVFGIVGMGGIGKTTLARKIMNDNRIKEKFPIRRWLYVSNNYSETALLREIVKDARGNDDGAEGIQELEAKVVSALDTDFFIVLDDVWSIDVWNDLLRIPILNAAANNNGKILVTSRDENIVKKMKAIHNHPVERMNEYDGWKLLCKMVFEDEDSKAYGLDDIGAKIVELCGGLPLAIKVVAGVLVSRNKTRREWEKVHESEIWHMVQMDAEIPKALYLSYEDLPSHLKECFLSCALYNGVKHCQDLARLWVAEGFVAEQRNNMLMEEVAEEYYKQLLGRSLLQSNPIYASRTLYTMHDLVRRLATNLVREEGIILTNDDIPNTNPLTKIRRLSLSSKGDILTLPSAITKQKCLRVLHLHKCYDTKTIEVGLLEGLQHLRILDICDTQIDILPGSLFELVHLRYLDLDRTMIREVPEAIGRLANLQTLNISACKSLYRLPDGITKLLNLRCLRLNRSSLTHMTKGIGRLTNLNHLVGFLIGHDSDVSGSGGCGLKELQSFTKLRKLKITKLERAITMGTPVLANKMKFLRHLCLLWTKYEGQSNGAPFPEEQIERAEKICDELMPPSAIEHLDIDHFPGRRFPDWIMSTSSGITLRSLTYLRLWDCSSCKELPPLGRFPQLKCLQIAGTAVKTIGREFLGFSSPAASAAFPKLELLTLQNMPNWEEWWLCEGEEGEDLKLLFPSLQECALLFCPKLRAIPQNLYRATNLKIIFVTSSDEYTQRECSSNHSGTVLVHDYLKGEPDWTEFFKKQFEDGQGKLRYPKSW